MKDEDRLDRQIEDALREEHAAPPFPRKQIEARIERSLRISEAVPRRRRRFHAHPVVRGGLAVAASLVVFVASTEYGRRTSAASPGVALTEASLSTPISIQSAGSEYVARLAQFGIDAGSLSDEVREEARQVAVATLYAATIV